MKILDKKLIPKEQLTRPFTEESLRAFEELGHLLRKIRTRIRSEGYDIINGEVVKIKDISE